MVETYTDVVYFYWKRVSEETLRQMIGEHYSIYATVGNAIMSIWTTPDIARFLKERLDEFPEDVGLWH